MALLIAFVVLSIGVSFVCSILEAALLSITPSFIAHQKQTHPKRYERLKALKDKIDQPLAAILTLNTIAHTVGALGVGAQVTVLYGDGYLGIASAVMTLLILVLSEILPKTIGARYWPQLTPFLPVVLNGMIFVLKPFIWFSDQIMKLFGGTPHHYDLRQEIKSLATLGRELNQLDEDEQRVIRNILDLHDIKVRDIMTPRTVCETIRPDVPLGDLIEHVRENQFSRYPVLAEDESPLGLVFRYDLLNADLNKTAVDIMKPVTVVIDTVSAERIMSQMMRERQHMCVVYDEYGSWLGLVTMEDVIETIIGQSIMDETDDIPNLRRFAKRRWEHKLKERVDDTLQ
ncbi:CNNM domain-containing protein [Permianibacter aggregans]|uniref:CBS domain containing-hemolysin-like protein n=1 Tax=Permianibacter aggregans TaxID=1510150 RepID=A0A4R6UKR6_9GAMM|nr:hemolysin family protein [Permianibacter aggregans]QGX40216.1 HlyC/CorC family transporter [Permianibacter aggregans]TDQ47471.1 CBS domain containing-hemolysin-like protein [Permianibacter aggregans]